MLFLRGMLARKSKEDLIAEDMKRLQGMLILLSYDGKIRYENDHMFVLVSNDKLPLLNAMKIESSFKRFRVYTWIPDMGVKGDGADFLYCVEVTRW